MHCKLSLKTKHMAVRVRATNPICYLIFVSVGSSVENSRMLSVRRASESVKLNAVFSVSR